RSKAKFTADLVLGSKQALTPQITRLEYEKSEAKMSSAVEWYRKEITGLETCASTRITPVLLSPVRITSAKRRGHCETRGSGHHWRSRRPDLDYYAVWGT
ncbi:hypothetical protein BDR03DRAFT_1048553, partial [Suillus americanus]